MNPTLRNQEANRMFHLALAAVVGIYPAEIPDIRANMEMLATNAAHAGITLDPIDISVGGRYSTEAEEEEKQRNGWKMPRVKDFCTEGNVHFDFGTGKPLGFHADINAIRGYTHAIDVFNVCGVIVVENALHGDFLADIKRQQKAVLDNYLGRAENDVTKFDFTEGKITSRGRYLVHLPFQYPFSDERLLVAPPILVSQVNFSLFFFVCFTF